MAWRGLFSSLEPVWGQEILLLLWECLPAYLRPVLWWRNSEKFLLLFRWGQHTLLLRLGGHPPGWWAAALPATGLLCWMIFRCRRGRKKSASPDEKGR